MTVLHPPDREPNTGRIPTTAARLLAGVGLGLTCALPALTGVWAAPPAPVPASAADSAAGVELFERKIRPVLAEKCYSCHSAKGGKTFGGLRLDSAAGIWKGGDGGAVVLPGNVKGSLLLRALRHEGLKMPPQGMLPAPVIADFERWVGMGAPLPAEKADSAHPAGVDLAAGRKHWAFQPLREVPVPKVSNPAWVRNPIDAFILARLDAEGMRPSPEADPRTLIRRVTYDLTGLPPAYEEVEAFVAEVEAWERGSAARKVLGVGSWVLAGNRRRAIPNTQYLTPRAQPARESRVPSTAPSPYEKLVDRLLASPSYGERWARHWLDVARYAEDNPTGEATNPAPAYPWRYRDWVVRALNEDLPYSEFLRRQLAADHISGLPRTEWAALGFLGLSPVYHKELMLARDVVETIAADEWDERLDTVTRGFLGLTVACARCHDHKFDPITQKDYYALAGVMASTQLLEWPLEPVPDAEAEVLARTEREIRETERDLRRRRRERMQAKNPAAVERAEKAIAEIEAKVERLKKSVPNYGVPMGSVVRDAGLWVNGDDPNRTRLDFRPGAARDLPLFIRGSVSRPGEVVPRRFLSVLSPGQPKPFRQGSGRLELANAMLTEAAPLTARVIVNRVWGWHFGRPLVETPSNFGRLGGKPSHPELLDYLAARFAGQGSGFGVQGSGGASSAAELKSEAWSMKSLHREIVLSAAYRQQSRDVPAYSRLDGDNRLLWRMNRRRLEVEAWRDGLLHAASQLDPAMGGPSRDLEDAENRRRTLYGRVSRQRPADVLRLFDFPDANRHGEQRLVTTTPLQQLYFLNSPFVQARADALAASCAGDGKTPEEGVRVLYRRILQRDPSAQELRLALQLVGPEPGGSGPASQAAGPQGHPPAPNAAGGSPDRARWSVLAQGLLASNAFLFVD